MKFEKQTSEDEDTSEGYADTFTDACIVNREEYEEGAHVKSFTTSQVTQSPQLKNYLEDLLLIPFNTFCVDCKENRTTHAVVWLGAFLCKDCADKLLKAVGGNQYCYIKDIFGEHWDDY